jgi:hypothetical protein
MLEETLIADFYRALLRSENSTLCVSAQNFQRGCDDSARKSP